MKKTWHERTRSEKFLIISRLAVSVMIFCAAIMQFLNIWSDALNLAIPLFAVLYLLETICNWKIDKDMAAFYLFMTIIITAVSCIVFFLQAQVGYSNSNLTNRSRVFGPCFYYALKKIEAKSTEVFLVLARKWRNPQKVLIPHRIPPSPNLEKVGKFV